MTLSTARFWPLLSANRRVYDGSAAMPGERIGTLEAELHAIRCSTSWRITAPLRWLMLAMRRVLPARHTAAPPAATLRPPRDYRDWLAGHACRRGTMTTATESGRRVVCQPRLGLVMVGARDGYSPAPALRYCPANCEILVLFGGSALPETGHDVRQRHASLPTPGSGQAVIDLALSLLDVDFIGFLDVADQLAADALARVADALARDPGLDMVFADEDWIDADGQRSRPFLKPAWDGELQRGRDLTGPFVLLRSALLRGLDVSPGPAWHYEMATRVAAASRPERIHHIADILCHRAARPAGEEAARQAIARAQLAREGVAARIERVAHHPAFQRVVYDVPQPAPAVSIIMPTRDQADLLRICARGILDQTDYDPIELLIVDNGSSAPDARALLDELAREHRVRVLRRPGAFNWSALNNHAARQASGDILVFLNNDMEVLRPDWLTELVSQTIQPGVGVVGAKLLYPDGRVQHAGLSTNRAGLPRHLLRFAQDTSGPFGLLALTREVWGVTGACMAVRRSVFHDVGGMNEALAIGCNDVDFCMRLRACGARIIWTPWAELGHHELASRGADVTAAQKARAREEHARLLRDWGSLMLDDPHYPAALDSESEWLAFFQPESPGVIAVVAGERR